MCSVSGGIEAPATRWLNTALVMCVSWTEQNVDSNAEMCLLTSVRMLVVTTRIEHRRLMITRHKWTWWHLRCHHAPVSLRVPMCNLSAMFVPASRNTVTGTMPLRRRWTWQSGGVTVSAWRRTAAPGKQTLRDISHADYSTARNVSYSHHDRNANKRIKFFLFVFYMCALSAYYWSYWVCTLYTTAESAL